MVFYLDLNLAPPECMLEHVSAELSCLVKCEKLFIPVNDRSPA
jgi:hypothetical protein